MPFHPPLVYPITDTRISGLSHLEQVKCLVVGGATLVQLREKAASSREFHSEVAECIAYAQPRGVRIIVNDRVDIALLTGSEGVHLGQDDMPPAAAREILGPAAVIGYSTHSLEQAIAAARMPVDYIAVGPIFTTATKQDPDPIVGLEGLTAVKSAVGELPIVAIGGIDSSNISTVIDAGADSVAIIRGILKNGQIAENLRLLFNKVQK